MDVLGLVLALRLTSANVGERASTLLLFTALGQRFLRLKTGLSWGRFPGQSQINLPPEYRCSLWRAMGERV